MITISKADISQLAKTITDNNNIRTHLGLKKLRPLVYAPSSTWLTDAARVTGCSIKHTFAERGEYRLQFEYEGVVFALRQERIDD